MSVVVYKPAVITAGTTVSNFMELGRGYVRGVTLSIFSTDTLDNLVAVRITSQGYNVLPMPSRGAAQDVYLENHVPVYFEINREINGPPYEVEVRAQNLTTFSVYLIITFEIYNTPYPQTRIIEYQGETPTDKLLKAYEPDKPEKAK